MNHSFSQKNTMLCIILMLILCISLLLLLYTLFIPRTNEGESKKEWVYIYVSEDESELESETETAEAGGWFLRIHGDRIGIFRADGSLMDILDVQTKTLPKADRALLEEGIYASTKEVLESLIEDYTE